MISGETYDELMDSRNRCFLPKAALTRIKIKKQRLHFIANVFYRRSKVSG